MSVFYRFAFTLAVLLLPRVASAHSPIKGIGVFFNGVLHPALVPAHLLLILALGLWFGQHQPKQQQNSVLLFLLAIILGLLATALYPLPENNLLSLLLLCSAAVIGLLTVSALKIARPVFIVLALVAGFLLGLDSTTENLSGKDKIASLFGSGVGIYFLMLYAMALSESFSKKHWQNIAVRILASWLSASALMVLAFHFSVKV
jgi:urease accessory protein